MAPKTFVLLFAFILVALSQVEAQGTCLCSVSFTGVCFEVNNRCDPGFVCPCTTMEASTCPTGLAITCSPDITGDPLFHAFDGSSFYFHGAHDKKYVLHAMTTGDMLVAKMRATNELWMGINRTYFDQFGVRLAGSDERLRFFLKRDVSKGRFVLAAEINGEPFNPDSDAPKTRISIVSGPNRFIVRSPFTAFVIKAVSLNSIYRRHLDFSVRIKKHKGHQFSGILGRTVSTSIPHRIRKKDSEADKKKFEMKMRELYNVPTLFPSMYTLKKVRFVTAEVDLS